MTTTTGGISGNKYSKDEDKIGIDNEKEDESIVEVKQWLISIEMDKYCESFTNSKYNSLQSIKEICSESELKQIGITKPNDIIILMHFIGILRNRMDVSNDEGKDEDIDRERSTNKENRPQNEWMEVEEWISNVIKLPQYCVVFMQNGLVSMDIIREITDESELRQIGIQNESHQSLIISEIQKL